MNGYDRRPTPSPAWDFFANRVAVLATMHRKEQVIAPLLQQELGLQVVLPEGLDTDQFGTFTRDRDRPGSQLEAARLKARKALELTGQTLAIASEGSFGPHPSLPAIACNRELVVLLDEVNQLEIVGQVVSLETNFQHQTVGSVEQAWAFAQKVGFPDHGLVVMTHPQARQADALIKGITDRETLVAAVTAILQRSPNGTAHLETDMRALYNPTRMKVIAQATQDLLQAIRRICPQCGCPGMQVVAHRPGLPCGLCGQPTSLTAALQLGCQKCQFQQQTRFPDGIQTADPAHCSYCNP